MVKKDKEEDILRCHFKAKRRIFNYIYAFFFKKVWLFQIEAVPLQH